VRASSFKFNDAVTGNCYALLGDFREQFRMILRASSYFNFFIGGIPAVAVLAWVATRSHNALALPLISIGACLIVMRNTAVAKIGWFVSTET